MVVLSLVFSLKRRRFCIRAHPTSQPRPRPTLTLISGQRSCKCHRCHSSSLLPPHPIHEPFDIALRSTMATFRSALINTATRSVANGKHGKNALPAAIRWGSSSAPVQSEPKAPRPIDDSTSALDCESRAFFLKQCCSGSVDSRVWFGRKDG